MDPVSPELAQRLSSEGALALVMVIAFLQAAVQITTSLVSLFTQRKKAASEDPQQVLSAIQQLSSAVAAIAGAVSKLTDVSTRLLEGQEHNEGTLSAISVQLQGVRDTLTTVNTRLEAIILRPSNVGGRR